jgi:chemotaxis protein methyltransferase CheR
MSFTIWPRQRLAPAIVDTLPESFPVLDDTLPLLAASRCFYELFKKDPVKAHGRSLFDLSDGQWNIPGLRQLLMTIADMRQGAPHQ